MTKALASVFWTAVLLTALMPAYVSATSKHEWRFEVFLDDKPIGFHHFRLTAVGETQRLSSEARFRVKILGLTLYDYVHRSEELWKRDCLQRISASTDDNGDELFVRGSSHGEKLVLESHAGTTDLPGCVMTFAYWNPALLSRQRLLNVQTGEYMYVRVEPLGESKLQLKELSVPARHFRIRTADNDIELWYSDQDDWLALRSTTSGGRELHYRRVTEAVITRSNTNE